MAAISRPSTPVDRITSVDTSHAPVLEPYRAPVSSIKVEDTTDGTPLAASNQIFTSPLDSPSSETSPDESDDFNYAIYQNRPDEAELILSKCLDEMDKDPQAIAKIPPHELKRMFVKCQAALRHYRFQSAVLKLHNKEVEKRNAVEKDLIKRQVDLLLKSPFTVKPKAHRATRTRRSDTQFTTGSGSEELDEHEMTPRNFGHRPHPATRSRVRKQEFRLVEKASSASTPRSTNFADHIKVFSLEKNI